MGGASGSGAFAANGETKRGWIPSEAGLGEVFRWVGDGGRLLIFHEIGRLPGGRFF